jgi:hypothetical protein
MCSEIKAEIFGTLVHSVLLNVGKSVWKMMENLWKNRLIIAKDVLIIHVNFIFIKFIYSEKKLESLLDARLKVFTKNTYKPLGQIKTHRNMHSAF